ncbi:hypothetical protein [Lichenibacterium dinghuense]|uniref:hypothetical protein n=1 Tax=Lichenibacterium dinghuense TaxID=2895977 RepID=UPI001F17C6D2|nr:hypothetical protein [Lichenibacterium sp. 6Y81]
MHGVSAVPSRAREAPLALVAVLVLVALCTLGTAVGRARSDLLFYGCAFAQGFLALAAAALALRSPARTALPSIIALAVALRIALLFTVPTLSGDVYRYIWDGRVVAAGFDPYTHVPADPALAYLRDPAQYGLIDKRDYAVTIYPPVAEALFALVTRVSSSVVVMKGAMVLLEGFAVLAMARLLSRLGRQRAWLAAYLLHPAPLWEIAGNGHADAAVLAALFGALAWGGGAARPYAAALAMTLGALAKPMAALGLPALWRPWRVLLPLAVLAFAALCYLPFALSAGVGVVGFLPSYAHEQGLDTGGGVLPLALLGAAGLARPWMAAAYAALAAAALLALALRTRWKGDASLRAALGGTALLAVTFLCLLTPTFPWYFLVAAPFTALLGLWSPFVLITGGFLLYGFNADAPAFLLRWSLLMTFVLLAAARDVRSWRGVVEVSDA